MKMLITYESGMLPALLEALKEFRLEVDEIRDTANHRGVFVNGTEEQKLKLEDLAYVVNVARVVLDTGYVPPEPSAIDETVTPATDEPPLQTLSFTNNELQQFTDLICLLKKKLDDTIGIPKEILNG